MGGFEFCRGQRPSPPRVAAPAKYYFAARIVHEKEKPFRGKALEDGPALGRQRANSPNQSERFEEADFLRSHGPDCRVDLVFGRADQDAVKLAELIYRRKLVQARASRGPGPSGPFSGFGCRETGVGSGSKPRRLPRRTGPGRGLHRRLGSPFAFPHATRKEPLDVN